MEAMTKFQELERDLGYTEELRKGLRADIGSTERVKKLSAVLRSTRPGICLHRTRAFTEIFSQTEGEPVEMRFAKAFCRTLEVIPAVINEEELIVGNPSCGLKKMSILPTVQATWLINELDKLSTRKADPVEITPGQIEEAKKLLPYWFDKTGYSLVAKLCPPEVMRKVVGTGWANTGTYFNLGGCHFNPPWELMARGF